MKKIKSYADILESVKERKLIAEHALNPIRIDKLKRLRDAGDVSKLLKELVPTIDQIIDICKNINYDDIEYSKANDIIKVSYKSPVVTLLSTLKDDTDILGDDVYQRIFGDGYSDL